MDIKKVERLSELLNNIIDASGMIDKMDVKEFKKNFENNKKILGTTDSKKHEFVGKVVDLFINTKIFSSAKSIVEFATNELNLKFELPDTTLFKRNKQEVIGHISVAIITEPNDKIEKHLDILSKIDTTKIKSEEEFKNSWSDLIRNIL